MKIALLLSGLPRQWQPSLLTQINMLAPNEVGVFFHFWDTVGASEKDEILRLTKPVAHSFEPQKDFSGFDHDPVVKPDNINAPSRLASQYYSWKQVGELFAPHAQEYDFALRSRADLHFVNSVNYIFPQLGQNNIVAPWWDENKLLADIFALGDPASILYYHRLYDRLTEYAASCLFNPEVLLMQHLAEAQPPIKVYTETNQQWYFVRRPHMAGMTLDECMKENPGRNKWLDPEVLKAHKDFHTAKKGNEGAQFVDFFTASQLASLMKEKLKP